MVYIKFQSLYVSSSSTSLPRRVLLKHIARTIIHLIHSTSLAFTEDGPSAFPPLDAAIAARTRLSGSMRKSEYLLYNPETYTGHSSLGFDAYTSFTSPIRKYVDLLVHRVAAQIAHGDITPKMYFYELGDSAITESQYKKDVAPMKRELQAMVDTVDSVSRQAQSAVRYLDEVFFAMANGDQRGQFSTEAVITEVKGKVGKFSTRR